MPMPERLVVAVDAGPVGGLATALGAADARGIFAEIGESRGEGYALNNLEEAYLASWHVNPGRRLSQVGPPMSC
jgi:hypothetical protein